MKKELCFVVVVLMESLCQQSGFCASDRIALVIGNQKYGENVADSLTNPVNDANAISEVLSQIGFEVIKKTNLNKLDMENSIREFTRKIEQSNATVALLYYSGHAAQIAGKNYLIPVSFDFNIIQYEPEAKDKSIDAEFPLEMMDTAGSKVKIMILDACRDNRFKKSRSAGGGNGLAAMTTNGSLIAFSTSPGKTANDLGDGNSVYTKSLIRNLKKIGEPISNIFEDVAADVSKESNKTQWPWYNSSLDGRFYFIPPNSKPDTEKPPQKESRTIGQYIDHGDGTITDTKTGLMWKRCAEGLSGVNCEHGETNKYNWNDAVSRFNNVAYAGYSDWRMPTIDELKTLIYCSNGVKQANIPSCKDGGGATINQQAFPNTKETLFWSKSQDTHDFDLAWLVGFNYGVSMPNFIKSGNVSAVRLVRGGNTALSSHDKNDNISIEKDAREEGSRMVANIWNELGKECSRADNLLTMISNEIDSTNKAIKNKRTESTYGNSYISGLKERLTEITNHCNEKCSEMGASAGKHSADLFCTISKMKDSPIVWTLEVTNTTDVVCGKSYITSCESSFVTFVKQNCPNYASGADFFKYYSAAQNGCCYFPLTN